jgi:hypothetical protein
LFQHNFQHCVSASVPALCFSICNNTVFQQLFQHCVSANVTALCFSCYSTVFQHVCFTVFQLLCSSICVPASVFHLCFSFCVQHLCSSICVSASVLFSLCSALCFSCYSTVFQLFQHCVSASVFQHLCSSICISASVFQLCFSTVFQLCYNTVLQLLFQLSFSGACCLLHSFTSCCPFQGIHFLTGSPPFTLSSPWDKRQPSLASLSASLFESLRIW